MIVTRRYSLVFGLGIPLALVGSPAISAENILYCLEESSAGLHNEDKYKNSTNFVLKRFTIKPINNNSTIILNINNKQEIYKCHTFGFILTCIENAYMFNFNPDNGRFTLAWGYGDLAPLSGSGDSLIISRGYCGKF